MQDDAILAKILVDANGPEINCGSPIALTVEDAAAYAEFLKLDPSSYAVATNTATKATEVVATPSVTASAVVTLPAAIQRFSPAARHMLHSKSIDPSRVFGTSKGGLISKADVIHALKAGTAVVGSLSAKPSSPVAATSSVLLPTTPTVTASAPKLPTPITVTFSDPTGGVPVNNKYTDIPNTNMRKIIAKVSFNTF